MTTSDPPGDHFGGGSSSPEELRLANSVMPTVGHTPHLPAAGYSTPGLAGAILHVPGQPTLPDFDPVSLTNVVARLANDLFAMPEGSPSPDVPSEMPAPSHANIPFGGALDVGVLENAMRPFGGPDVFSFALLDHPPAHDAGAHDLDLDRADRSGLTPQTRDHRNDAAPPPAPRAHVLDSSAFPEPAYEVEPTREARSNDKGRRSVRPSEGGTTFDPHALKREFPILHEHVNGRPLVWLDNAATTQKPRSVIDRISYFYEHENSNIHRAAHTLAARATDAYEKARESTRRFINAGDVREIIFVRGATEGINLVAQTWGRRHVNAGDEIVITHLEHHANIVPWQQLCLERGARLRVAPVDDRGQVLLGEYEKLLNTKTRLVAFTQVSNALGTITPAQEMIAMAQRHGARVLLDGAQAVSHQRVDVQALGCDFFVFSGHKVFAPTGIGAVFGRSELLEHMPPWQGGGNMIQDVTFERTVYQPPPARFEAGTGNIGGAVGLGAALDWVTRVGIERIEAYEHGLLEYATERLAGVPGLTMIGTAPQKAGVLSFTLAGQKTEEVGGLLDREGIAVRSGHHCAQPILRRFGVEATVRASLAPYNTSDDIDALVAALKRIQTGRVAPR